MADFDVSRFRTTSFMTIWDLLKEVLVNMVKWFVRSHAENTNRAGKYLANTMFAM